MKTVYEVFNTKHKRFSKFLRGPMHKIHYEHPKEHHSNTLERRIEELEHMVQWRQGILFAIKYVLENIYNAVRFRTLDVVLGYLAFSCALALVVARCMKE